MIPVELIERADDALENEARIFWLSQIRSLAIYKQQKSSYPDLEGRLVAVQTHTLADPTGHLETEEYSALICQTMNAAFDLIKEVGSGKDRIEAGPRGLNSSDQANREEFVEDVLNLLYDSGVRASQIEIADNSLVIDKGVLF